MSQWTHDESSLCTLSKTTHCVSRGANDWPTNQNEEPVDQWATGLGPSYHLSPAANHLVKPISIQQKCPRWKKTRWETFSTENTWKYKVWCILRMHANLYIPEFPYASIFLQNFVKIVVSNVYWLMEIKLQIICSISFSGETIRSNYKNKNLFIFTALTFLKCVGGSIAQRCWIRILNHFSGPSNWSTNEGPVMSLTPTTIVMS